MLATRDKFTTTWLYLIVALISLLPSVSSQRQTGFEAHNYDRSNWHESPCEPPQVTFCKKNNENNYLFNLVHQINVFGQSQDDTNKYLNSFPMASSGATLGCHPDSQLFFCSLLMPMCPSKPESNVPNPTQNRLLPCRKFCYAVKAACETDISSLLPSGWPLEFDCHRMPESDPCVSPSQHTESAKPKANTPPTSVRTSVRATQTSAPPSASTGSERTSELVVCRYEQDACPLNLRVTSGYSYSLRLGACEVGNCGMPCQASAGWPLARTLIGVAAIVCAATTAVTLLTFLIDLRRFLYPERPIVYLCACYLLIAACYVAGFVLRDRVSCTSAHGPGAEHALVATQGTKEVACTIMFMHIYFFSLAASIWWLVLCFTWFLAAGRKWSCEAIEARSQYFHLAAWAVPACMAIAILASNQINGDPLTGTCFTGLYDTHTLKLFVLVPQAVCWAAGVVFLVLGFISLCQIRTIIKTGGSKTDKFERLMVRIGIFSLLYSLPMIALLGCYVHEVVSHEPQTVAWFRESYCAAGAARPQPASSQLGALCRSLGAANVSLSLAAARAPPPALSGDALSLVTWPLVVRHALLFVVGIATTSWICSRKTFQSWRAFLARLLCCCRRGDTAYQQAASGAVQSPSGVQLSHVTAQNLLQAPNNSNANNSAFGVGSASGDMMFLPPQHVQMVGLSGLQQPLLAGYRSGAGSQNMPQLQNLQNMRLGGVAQHPAGVAQLYTGIAVMPAGGAAQSSSLSASTGLTQPSGSGTQAAAAPTSGAKPVGVAPAIMRYPVANLKAAECRE